MKTKFKFIVLLLFCFVIFTNAVQAVEQVCWGVIYYETETPSIIYRTTVRPFWTTEKNIIFNQNKNYNEWITDSSQDIQPTNQTYGSDYLMFTKSPVAKYEPNENSNYGYIQYGADTDTSYLLTSSSVEDFYTWWNNTSQNSEHKKVNVEDKWLYQFETDANGVTNSSKFDLDGLGGYLDNIIDISDGNSIDVLPVDYVTSKNWMAGITNIEFKNKLVEYKELRKMLYNDVYGNLTRTEVLEEIEKGEITNTLYVSDIYINEKATDKILNYLRTKPANTPIYVSAISKTLTWSNQYYFYMITPENFLHAKSNKVNASNWSKQTLGTDGGGAYSGLNLWDNELKIDAQEKSKTVVINHIYVDEKGNTVDYFNIDRGLDVSLYVNDKSIYEPDNATNLKADKSESSYTEKYIIDSEIDKVKIKSLKELNSSKNWTKELKADKYDVAGFAVYTGKDNLNTLENEAKNHTKYPTALTDKDKTNIEVTFGENNVAVVNVYYTIPTIDIEVRHYYVNQYYISGNGYGLDSDGNKYLFTRVDDVYGIEYYDDVNRYESITFSKRTDINKDYIGYTINEDLTSGNISSSVGSSDGSIVVNKTLLPEAEKMVIIFKYQKPPTENKTELYYEQPPEINIQGILSVKSILDVAKNCTDEYGNSIYSVPTNAVDPTEKDPHKDIYVGIKNIPNYILAGMSVKKLEHDGSSVKINVVIKFGPNSKKWAIEVPYYLSYYVVDHLLMYKFDKAYIYNTNHKDAYGANLFASKDDIRTISPTKTNTLKLWGVTNKDGINDNSVEKQIDNNTEAIENWQNYLITSYKTNYNPLYDPNRLTEIFSKPQGIEGYKNENQIYNGGDKAGHREIITIEGYKYSGVVTEIVMAQYNCRDVSTGENPRYTIVEEALDEDDPETYIAVKEEKGVLGKTMSHGEIKLNEINDYISLNSYGINSYISSKANIYEKITLDNEVTVTLTLLSQQMFNAVSAGITEGSDDIAIEPEDIRTKIKKTNTALNELNEEILEEFKTAYNKYEDACSDNRVSGSSFPTCYEYISILNDKSVDACECSNNNKEEPSKCNQPYKAQLNAIKPSYDEYIITMNKYKQAKTTVIDLYENEKFALQNFDEAYYIQNVLWNEYKKYSVEQIIKLLDLDILFEYSSGGARLEGEDGIKTELLTVPEHKVELNTDMIEAKDTNNDNDPENNNNINNDVVLGNHGSLEYNIDGVPTLKTNHVGLYANRQYLTSAQMEYYTKGIGTASWIGEGDVIFSTDYKNNKYTIPITALNGRRILAATSLYTIHKEENIVGKKEHAIQDNLYYNNENTQEEKDNKNYIKYGSQYSNVAYNNQNVGEQPVLNLTEYVFDINILDKYKSYGANKYNTTIDASGKKTTVVNSQTFNIYTPLTVTATVNQDVDIIDQTEHENYNANSSSSVIQANSNFTVYMYSNYDYAKSGAKTYSTTPDDFTSRYLNKTKYYVKFMFDVDNVRYIDESGYEKHDLDMHYAGDWIGPICGPTGTDSRGRTYDAYLKATARINTEQGNSVTDYTTEYYVLAVAINTTRSWTDQVLEQMKTSLSDITSNSLLYGPNDKDDSDGISNICGTEGDKKISYYADNSGDSNTLTIVNRIYDFRVTDVKDVDWKNVFRNDNDKYTHTGIAYYSGFSKWNTEDPTKYNEIIGRTQQEIGSTDQMGNTPARVLPVGPYKHTNKSYTAAPKMGYRFSFDLKVTGAKNENKYVTITPKFYYIKKDGTDFYEEYTSGKKGIYLFYKNSQGQYVRIGSSQDTYKIQFVPYDGYRSLVQASPNNLSKTNVELGSLRQLTLKYSTTSTYSQNDSSITYYGEYKLPNSTIAVLVDETGKYNINKPLSNGYIGVIFDIVANETNGTKLHYGINSFRPSGGAPLTNTSQWDYEGYLGFTNPGNVVPNNKPLTLRLEKGTWSINNDMYNKIKGTVMLYDLDNKASNDFN